MNWPHHGGQPEAIRHMFQIPSEKPLLDFSANLNPLGPPNWLASVLTEQIQEIERYPDPEYQSAREAIARHDRVSVEHVVLANGGAEAIFLVAKLFEGKKALLIQPTFLEYERACQHYHLRIEHTFLDEKRDFAFPLEEVLESMSRVDVIFLCRPNNPTGTVVDREALASLLDEGKKTGTTICVDEAFIDFLPSSPDHLSEWVGHHSNLILLRSLTKMYTAPGLRIGYLLSNPHVTHQIRANQLPWSVNALASSLVPPLVEDHSFVDETRKWVSSQLDQIKQTLQALDFYCSPSRVNFYLLQDRSNAAHIDSPIGQTEELYQFLLEHGILARHTHNFRGLDGHYLRLAVRTEAENQHLLDVVEQWREEK